MGKGSKRRVENFAAVQQNWPANMGKKPYWDTWSKFSDEFYNQNKDILEENILNPVTEKEIKLKYKQLVEIAEAQDSYENN